MQFKSKAGAGTYRMHHHCRSLFDFIQERIVFLKRFEFTCRKNGTIQLQNGPARTGNEL